MTENKLFLELISSDKVLVSEEVDSVYAPGTEGDLNILPHHIEFLTSLRVGEFTYRKGNITEYVAVDGGFMEVLNGKVTVLADSAELGRDINIDEVIRRKEQAEKELEIARKTDAKNFKAIEAQLIRELLKLEVAGRYRGIK